MYPTVIGQWHIQSSCLPDATNRTQQGHRAGAMRVVATITLATFMFYVLLMLLNMANMRLGLSLF